MSRRASTLSMARRYNPDTVVNHTPYNDKFSSRGFDFDDEDEDW